MSEQKLKKWNGRGHGIYARNHLYISAYSQKEACRLIGEACKLGYPISTYEFKNFYSDVWGNGIDGIEPSKPCVYVTGLKDSVSPVKVLEI